MSISNYIASAYSSIGTARANITRAVVLSDGTVVEDPSDVHLHNRARDIKNRLLAEREQLLKDLNTVHPSERARVQAEINRIDEKLENPSASNSQSNTRGINQDELNEAFDDFVVPLPESDEMRTVPAGIVGIIPKLPSQEVTLREAELINSRSYPQQKHLLEIQKDALSVAGEMFPQSSLHNGNGDAFRHAYWNAIMTREFGVDFTRELTNAHEAVPGGGPRNEVFMDLHNN